MWVCGVCVCVCVVCVCVCGVCVWVCGVCVIITPFPYPIVREKAKALVSLLKDEERLKEERRRAHLARERQIALGSNNTASGSPKTTSRCVQCVCTGVPKYIIIIIYRVKFADTARSSSDG